MSDYVYGLPSSGELYEILTHTIAPNLTFTQCNLFECLTQIFMYLDGYPILDKNGVLGIRYFNDNNGTQIETGSSDFKKTISEERYVNGLITDFQNAELNNVLTYPSKKTYSAIQSKDIGIVEESDYIMRVDKPIYKLRSVKVYAPTFILKLQRREYSTFDSGLDQFTIIFDAPIDLIDNILPQDIYINLKSDVSERGMQDLDNVKENSLYYSQKNTYIEVGTRYTRYLNIKNLVYTNAIVSAIRKMCGLYTGDIVTQGDYQNNVYFEYFSKVDDIKTTLKYQIEYETLTNGRVLVEGVENKYNGAERLDIGQGGADIMKTGLNLLGTTIKTGVDTLVRTEKFLKTEDRIKVGSIYYENGDKYIATKVDECVFGDFVFSTIQYTKNFNKLSQFIAIDQKKRFNEIDSSLTLRSEDVYKEYLYFSLNSPSVDLISDIHIYSSLILEGLKYTFDLNPTNSVKIDYASCETKNYDGTSNSDFGRVWLPMVQYGSGNALCFEMAFESSISANSNFKYDETLKSWYSKYILYTSNDGFADTFTINFYNQTSDFTTNDLPQITSSMVAKSKYLGGFNNLHYYKKPNEIFAMNYELLCLPYNNQEIFIGEKFIKYNGMIGNAQPKKELTLYISESELYSILDKQGIGSKQSGTFSVSIFSVSENTQKSCYGVRIYKGGSLYQLDKKIKSWALCDEYGDIYISANQNKAINENLTFYLFTSHSRL